MHEVIPITPATEVATAIMSLRRIPQAVLFILLILFCCLVRFIFNKNLFFDTIQYIPFSFEEKSVPDSIRYSSTTFLDFTGRFSTFT